jgi:glycosyltransferase involved in cell wall biosynthesis
MSAAQPSPASLPSSDKVAVLLAMSALADDPRVRRMGDFLHANGWQVVGIGATGAKSPPPEWRIFEAQEPTPPEAAEVRTRVVTLGDALVFVIGLAPALIAATVAGVAGIALLPLRPPWGRRMLRLARTTLNPVTAFTKLASLASLWLSARVKGDAADEELMCRQPVLRTMRDLVLQHGRRAIWVANDWLMLPLAAEGARTHGGAYVYDSHEFATLEFAQQLDWRIFRRPLVQTIERRHIANARVVTTVSPEITTALQEMYRFSGDAATLRNMPVYQALPFRAVRETVRVLYHGILVPHRGLENAVASLAHWPRTFTLTFRGPGSKAYIDSLIALAARHGVAQRFTIEPPLPLGELVSAASSFDIGLLALPGHSTHNAYALPNKIYEYLMAGLALCVSELPSMAAVVRETGAGILCGDGGPASLARAMANMTPAAINALKAKALEAARSLHFETDAPLVLGLYLRALQQVQSVRGP